MKAIARDLEANQFIVFSVATAFLLAQTIFQPLFSETYHLIGMKPVYLFAFSAFTIGSIMAATSQATTQLIAGRVVQGFGSAGCHTLSAMVLTDIFKMQERAAWVPISNAFGGLGSICGPFIAAGLVNVHSWVR